MFDNQTTRFQYGVTNSRETGLFSDMPTMDDARMHQYLEDFDYFTAANYTITKTGTGTTALAAGQGGLLLLTNSAANGDLISLQKVGASFQLAKGLRNWGKVTFQVDSLLAGLLAGLVNVTTTPFTGGQITDGIWLSNAGAGSALTVNIAVGGTITSLAVTPALVAASNLNFAWYWDGANYSAPQGRVLFDLSGTGVAATFRGEITLPVGTTFPGAVNLTPTLGIFNSTAAARSMTVDQIFVLQDRNNILATPVF